MAAVLDPGAHAPVTADGVRTLRTVVALACAGAAVIHFAFAPDHFADRSSHGMFFMAVAWVQVGIALSVGLGKGPSRLALVLGALFNLGVIGVWIASRTVGIDGPAEAIAFPDGLSTALAAISVIGSLALAAGWFRSLHLGEARSGVFMGAGAMAVALLVTASINPSTGGGHSHAEGGHGHDGTEAAATDDHGHDGTEAAADDHGHDEADGVETAAVDGEHGHDDASAEEFAAARMEALIGPLSDDELATRQAANRAYMTDQLWKRLPNLKSLPKAEADAKVAAFVKWTTENALSSEHGAEGGEHAGNHTDGPTDWIPLTDPEEDALLQRQLKEAGSTMGDVATAADAMRQGYFQVTPFVPGIGAHYINIRYANSFDTKRPAMLLYNGNLPTSELTGYSYAVYGKEAPEGFAGENDSWHVHPALCMAGAFVIGSDAMPEDVCESVGGEKGNPDNPTKLWMMHLWQVPGWESYWGLFSGENPTMSLARSDPNPTTNPG